MQEESFPLRIVTGDQFCNRTVERKRLSKMLQRGTSVWLQAHRRHGKSSLLVQVGEDMKAQGLNVAMERCHILFNSGKESIIKQLLKTTDKLMGAVAQIDADINGYSKAEALTDYIKSKFDKHDLNIKIEKGLPSISFDRHDTAPTIDTLRNALDNLDIYACEANIRVVFVIDEFQELSKTEAAKELESAIRDSLELSKAIAFVFCGSERTLMKLAMTDSQRPLYNHTTRFDLERIQREHYIPHITKMAFNEWKEEIDVKVIDEILKLTERHPYYVNLLCSELWLEEEVPAVTIVRQTWSSIVDRCERDEKGLLQSLTTNEKKLLAGIANGHTEKLTSKAVLSAMGLASSSLSRSLNSLVEKDVVEQTSDMHWRIVKPVITEIARRYS